MNPPHLRKRFKHATHRRAPRPLILVAMLGAALLIVLPLSLRGQHRGRSDAPEAFSLANVAGGGGSSDTRGTPKTGRLAPSGAAPAARASATVAPSTPATKPSTPAPKPSAPSAKDLKIDFQYQINGWFCGPASTRIAASTRISPPSQSDIAAAMGTTTAGTNSAEDTTRELNALEHTSFYHTTSIPGQDATPAQMDQLQANVVHAISNGYGVVANIVGSATDTSGGWHEYDGGHYIAVFGYSDDGRKVHIADPAGESADTYWMTTIDLANWMGTRGYSS